ncbi:hypothetical protein [Rhodopirellula europaea]|uniref:hypothetical protein n=1 Tax=Rhodopirellula europaea TaxID=1263866 RepID=UPI003D2861C1
MLIDGHNRYEICTRLGIDYSVSEMQFDCRDDAENWIDVNQAGKRNLGPISFRIVSGRIYNRRKKKHGGDRKSKCQVGTLNEASKAEPVEDTALEVAEELGVSKRTIHRNGQRAALHDDMVAIGDKEAADAVKTMPQADVSRLAKDDSKPKGEQSDEDKAEAERQRRLKISPLSTASATSSAAFLRTLIAAFTLPVDTPSDFAASLCLTGSGFNGQICLFSPLVGGLPFVRPSAALAAIIAR